MKRLFLVIVTLLCAAAFTRPIQACECRDYSTPICARFWRSDVVFVGQLIDIKPLKKKPDNIYTYVMPRFIVEESFRGVSGPRIEVATATTLCDPVFKKGKRYLVYSSLHQETNQLFTGYCNGTGLAVDIDDTVKELRKLRQREVEESISGRVVFRRYQGVPGIKIEVTSKDKTFNTVTNKYGQFSFSLPAPGSFKVRVLVPYSARLMGISDDDVFVRSTQTDSLSAYEYDVTLEKSECSYLTLDIEGIDTRASATVAGNVLTATGQGIERGTVHLLNVADTGSDYGALVKNDGSFTFKQVAPGEYYLVLNDDNEVPDERDAPYARIYYPAAADKREAKTIQVTEGATIENLVMRVGERMSERIIEGKAVWKSGRALEYPYLRVYSGDKYVRRARIMREDGTFKFILYGDFDYSIEAWDDDDDEIEGHSQRVKIPPGNSAGHKLIIQRIKQ